MRLLALGLGTLVLGVFGLLGACANGDAASDTGDGTGSADEGGTSNDSDGSVGTTSGGDGGGAEDTGGGGSDAAQDTKPVCVATDAGCTTGSPGACGAGVMDCDDAGTAYCRPLATTQACYGGAPGTRGKGACKDGLQTCTGTLGACQGEVDPTPHENCFNTTDDDCDGALNNGCPDHLTIGAGTPLAAHGGTGGGAQTAMCPPNSFVTRADWYWDDGQQHASGVGIYCSSPTLVQGASSYSVTLTPQSPAPYKVVHGNDTATIDNNSIHDCGGGFVAGSWFIGTADSFVEGLGMHCSNGAVTLNADNTLAFNFTEFGNVNDYWYFPGGTFFRDDCPTGQVLIGFNMRVGNWLDQIQAVCAPLLTVYK
jgi:hypothetical protein